MMWPVAIASSMLCRNVLSPKRIDKMRSSSAAAGGACSSLCGARSHQTKQPISANAAAAG
jgi:hypothetical protein